MSVKISQLDWKCLQSGTYFSPVLFMTEILLKEYIAQTFPKISKLIKYLGVTLSLLGVNMRK